MSRLINDLEFSYKIMEELWEKRPSAMTATEQMSVYDAYPDHLLDYLSMQLGRWEITACTEETVPMYTNGQTITFVKLDGQKTFLFGSVSLD